MGQNSLRVDHVPANQHTFRVAHAAHLIDVLKRWQVSAEDLLAGLDFRQEALADPRAQLSVSTLTAMLERARMLTGEPALGLYIGLHTRATLYGYLGFAVLSASTIREGIDLSIRFGRIVTTALSMRLRVDRRMASLIIDEHTDFGSVRDIVMISSLVGLWQVSQTLTGRSLPSTAEFALPEPSYSSRIAITGLRVRFNRPVTRLSFDARHLEYPYVMPDQAALRLARDQCQRELDSLGLNGRLTERVRALISKPEGGCRSLEEVAATLHQSTRTLKRQLAGEGASFLALREDERRERALVLLRSPHHSLAEIATRLGYANLTSFERAFRRWTARTPADWRRSGTASERP
jgi:AraC-like DNA-binding protein